jgi:hypothetical protein
MPDDALFEVKVSVADRLPKTDRLMISRILREAAEDKRFVDTIPEESHRILIKWADLETSGRLKKLKETQLQGDFLAEVFGDALGYHGPTDNEACWHREQHHTIAGETPDAILGHFLPGQPHEPLAVIELKGPKVHLDRDRSNGRTAVRQCWDYLNNTSSTCRWAVLSNYVSFRLYERDSTQRVYEHFTLQSLRDPATFRQFYTLFHRQGLIENSRLYQAPVATALLKKSRERQREVGEQLYKDYDQRRYDLIRHFHCVMKFPVEQAIEMAQRLFDRIIFIAFCEDRNLLPNNTIPNAYTVAGFQAVTNPRWQNFKNLFRFMDEGSETYNIERFNGGLFARHPVDDLELPDSPWTGYFRALGDYNFADEVNLDVLGNLFERSITELEKLKETGLFGGNLEKITHYAAMPQAVKRKQLGVYYTPPELTSRIVRYTIDELIDERFTQAAVAMGISEKDAARGITPDSPDYWRTCLNILRDIKIVDPACGSGAFLFQAYNTLENRYGQVIEQLKHARDPEAADHERNLARYILQENLFGVDLSLEAVEITQLALWIRSATPGQTLSKLSDNIIQGNSLVHDPAVHPLGFDWKARFPQVFDRAHPGFDCIVGNPPWERMDLSEREFFSLSAPEIATATTGDKRKKLIDELAVKNPEIHERYIESKNAIDAVRSYCQNSGTYPLTGRGRTNFYAVFAELAYKLVASLGRVGLLVPSGIATDMTTKDFFAAIAETNRLIRLYDFENRLKTLFPEVDGRFKFSILNFGGEQNKTDEADYIFFVHHADEVDESGRHIALSSADIKLLNPNTRTCPIFRTRRDAEITKAIYRRVPVLIDRNRQGPTGNPWGISFKQGLFNQTTDSHLFMEANTLRDRGFKLSGNQWKKGDEVYLPVYEAKMIQAFDHRAADILTDESNWLRQGQTDKRLKVHYTNPEYVSTPRFWVQQDEVSITDWGRLGFKDITSPTNQRTMIAAFAPKAGFTNHFILCESATKPLLITNLSANFNSYVFDFCVRQKIGGVTLNFFIVEQLPTLPPDTYAKPCPWQKRPKQTLEQWIAERVLKLTCTAEDMLPLAEACGFTAGSFQTEYGGRLHKWDEADRAELMAELDAAYFHLYGVSRDDAEYILSTFKGIDERNPLLPGHISTATRILQLYDQFAGK